MTFDKTLTPRTRQIILGKRVHRGTATNLTAAHFLFEEAQLSQWAIKELLPVIPNPRRNLSTEERISSGFKITKGPCELA